MGLGEIRGIGDTELSKAKQYNEWWVQFNYLEVRWTKNNEGFGLQVQHSPGLTSSAAVCWGTKNSSRRYSPVAVAATQGSSPSNAEGTWSDSAVR